MTKKTQIWGSFLILAAAMFWSFYGTGPRVADNVPLNEFSVERAFVHVRALSREPHYVGSPAHREVRNYIIEQLEKMGLVVQTQEAYSVNKYGTVTRPQNIISRIEGSGNGKSLLLMSHYDSAMHSSYGASDAASGVATILEGVRAYLEAGKKPVNDVIILFTDAEEIGLNGAAIFVEDHPWAEKVGLALNFESRGSGGKSFMLMETNHANGELLEEFKKAGVEYPVTNSLVYNIYKMLPNDTDLTVLREQGDISGLNFAFIDDHFDYHTATDLPQNLDVRSLAHQGSYLMPLLSYFSQVPIKDMNSDEEMVFFNVPLFDIISYPNFWIYPMLTIGMVFLLLTIGFGLYNKSLSLRGMLSGFIPLSVSLILSGSLGYGLWNFILLLYPNYLEMEQGFTYNGYYYIGAVIFLTVAVCFYTYAWFRKKSTSADLFVAPLFFWSVLAVLTALYLKGAAYFIIPVLFGIIQLVLLCKRNNNQLLIQSILSLPAIFLLVNFIVMFPVALGLKILFLSAILTVLLWTLLWPVFSKYSKLQLLGFVSFIVFVVLFMFAHFKSDYTIERPRPNSLVYLLDHDRDLATWNSYDHQLDSWNATYFEDALDEVALQPPFGSKYGSEFRHTSIAPVINVPAPFIGVDKVASENNVDSYVVKIAPNREIDRIEVFLDKNFDFRRLKVNGKVAPILQPGHGDLHVFKNRWTNRLLTYYPVSRDTLRLELSVEKGEHPQLQLYESAYNLIGHPELEVPPREEGMIPRPFVLNDAVILQTHFIIE